MEKKNAAAADWVETELGGADLKDRRLNERLVKVAAAMASNPAGSIPAVSGDFTETMGAYRLFANPKATAEAILAPHWAQTVARIRAEKQVLLVQDTTELDLTRPERTVAGAGPLSGKGRQGMFLHTELAFTTQGVCLGSVWSKRWMRPPDKVARARSRPLAQKESVRWVEALAPARALAAQAPGTQVVCVADSEADMYELFAAAPAGPERPAVTWLVRACHDRTVRTAGGTGSLRAAVAGQPVCDRETIEVRARPAPLIKQDKRARHQPRASRTAEVEVRAIEVELSAPHGCAGPALPVHAVLVSEVSPPPGEPPVEWLLLTTLPITTAEAVRQIVEFYRLRFLIEVYFRTLKSGCRIEQRQFEYVERFSACLAVCEVIAWRILHLTHLARSQPERSCATVFSAAEWRAAWALTERTAAPATPPSLWDMTLRVAQLGGYLRRGAKSPPPGAQTLWRGLARLSDLAAAWIAFGPPTYV